MVPSLDADMTHLPSSLKDTSVTQPSWPCKMKDVISSGSFDNALALTTSLGYFIYSLFVWDDKQIFLSLPNSRDSLFYLVVSILLLVTFQH